MRDPRAGGGGPRGDEFRRENGGLDGAGIGVGDFRDRARGGDPAGGILHDGPDDGGAHEGPVAGGGHAAAPEA
jgi:hypothetical protein